MADQSPKDRNAHFVHMFDSATAGEGPFHVKGGDEADIITIGEPKTWKRVSTPCAPGQHDPVLDETETGIAGYVGYRCRNCKIGWIVKEPVMVDN